ncbi:MAG: glycoside hydrolase family 95 protein [Chitinophagaceae bacterium]|nr:MAG: glycoside hydrolase family 95 protein [Chitinophagaceae bacterium]
MPIGNGKLGAMVYGNPGEEIIRLNEHSLWSGGPNRNDNPLALAALPELRSLIQAGEYKAAEKLSDKVIISKTSHGQMFQPLGNIWIKNPGHDQYSEYLRELKFDSAKVNISYTSNGVKYRREMFASLKDSVIVIRLTADKPGSLNFSIGLNSLLPQSKVLIVRAGVLQITGHNMDHEGVKGVLNFNGQLSVKAESGQISNTDSSIIVKDANTVTIRFSAATNFVNYHDVSGDAKSLVTKTMRVSDNKTYNELLKSHTAAYKKYYDRVKLDLGDNSRDQYPTDERLAAFASSADPAFAALYFQYGRYLLISGSSPGGQPANLQGIWNNKLLPPWDSKYTININAEMNYWPAEKTNLSELHQPFLKMVSELSQTGRKTAKDMYGARGWMAHHNTDIWRATGAVDAAFYGTWLAGGGWTSQHIWEHYLYTGNKTFLAKNYEVLKGAALFYVDFLIEEPTHKWLVVSPGMSPENAPAAHQGSSVVAGATMDNQIVFDVFSNAIRAAATLGRDANFVDTLKAMRDRLPPMQIGKHGQLQEWIDDVDDPKDEHRHISHLYGLFPSNQISRTRTPELFKAAKQSLVFRGDVSTGWSMGWKVNWWARLEDGDHAYKLIKDQLKPVGSNGGGGGTYPNLFDAHPPFQIDGNFGCTSGIAEMIVQSSDGAVQLLPAIPADWPAGKVNGLVTRGGFEITELEWKDSKVTKLVIRSGKGGNLRIATTNKLSTTDGKLRVAKGSNPNALFYVETVYHNKF